MYDERSETLGIIFRFDETSLKELIEAAQERIYFAMPGIYEEIAESIIHNNSLFIKKKLILNIDEDLIRGGYGSLDAIEKLRNNNIEIEQSDNSLISFIIIDDAGYIIFPKSRILPGTENADNAIRMDSQMLLRLIALYFPEDKVKEERAYHNKFKLDKKETLRILKEERSKSDIKPLDEKKVTELKQEFTRNPVVNPDLKRQLTTYSSKLQYVDLAFKGAHLDKKRINIPPKALPVRDEEFLKKLEINMALFGDFQNSEKNPIREMENKVNEIRKDYLTPIGGGKSIIYKNQKSDFEKEVSEIEKSIKELPEKLYKVLKNEIKKTRDRIENELIGFIWQNPPENIVNNIGSKYFGDIVRDEVNKILAKIHFPAIVDVLNKEVTIEYVYSDITYDDLKSTGFLDKLVEKKVIDKKQKGEIVKFKDAVEVKK